MKLQNIFRFALATILLSLLIHTSLFSQFSKYNVTFIPNFLGYDINDSSEIIGYDPLATWGCIKWKNGISATLPSLYGYSLGIRINNASQVIGLDSEDNGKICKAMYWPNSSTVVDLGTLPGCNKSNARAINSSGVICGVSWFDTGNGVGKITPFIYSGAMTPYPVYDVNAGADDINDSGWVLENNINTPSALNKTYILHGEVVVATIPGFRGNKINNNNEVVGFHIDLGACYWRNGILSQLPSKQWDAWPVDINDRGIIIGYYGRSANHGAIWKGGQMNYLDSLVPASCQPGRPFAINNKGEIISYGLSSDGHTVGTYLLTPTGQILAPHTGVTWISGEQDTIKWQDIDSTLNLTIEFSSDSGLTYNAIAANVSADSGKYIWDIPKDILSTKCFIRLRDFSTNDTLAVSEMFKIKPYIITRIDDNGNYVTYDKTIDRWGFGNYPADVWSPSFYGSFNYRGTDPFTGLQYPQDAPYIFLTAQPQDFTDWVSFVNAFGLNACYYSGIYYKPEAMLRWAAMKGKWNGSCFAIAGSNALAFEKKDEFLNKFTGFPNFATPVSVTSNPGVIKTITELYSQAYGNPTSSHENSKWLTKTPNQTLNDLKEMLKTDDTKIRTLSFWHNSGSGGHCILPYKVERSTIINTNWLVWVWDNSYPNDATAFVYIDTSGNNNNGIWYYSNWQNWGGPGKLILELESSTYLGTPTLPKGQLQYSPFILSDTILHVITTYNADITISDNQGHTTGYADSVLSYDIPESVPMILPTGSETPPYGYHLHTNDYSVVLDNFTADTIDTYFFTGNKIFSYGRYGAIETQTDRLYFEGGITATNPDAEMKSINLLSLINDTINQKLTLIRSLELAENDSIKLDNLDGGKYKLASFGTAKSYLLELHHVSDSGLVRFRKSGVSLGSNTTHTIEPNWDDLQESLLTVLVDVGNNGTIDDTLKLQNELTGIHDHGSLIPSEYKLYQNYPNPFNPLTTIVFDLPKASLVTLKVYNILGQEVATLVNEKREAGSYEVEFDGSKLTSGVYFYRLGAGEFVSVKKLMLMK